MAKVVTKSGTEEFKAPEKVESKEAPKLEQKEAPKAAPPPEEKAEAKPETSVTDEGLDPDDIDLTEHVRKKINKKHRQMKEAQEEAAEDRRLAESQYNRAILAERKIADLETQLQALKKEPEKKEPELKKPDIKDFTDDKGQVRWTDYTDASADYAAKKAVTDERARQAQEREQQARAQAETAFKARLDAATKKYPDFTEVVGKSETWFPNAVLQYITESDYGPDVSYHLATHPEAAERISKLAPIKAIAEIGKLELTFEKPPAKAEEPKPVERGGAPPPITPLSASSAGTVQTDPSKMSFKELREYERQRRQKR